ncbi:hypothetical protein Plhal304r1_c056g0141541 [Plasmopara halstedii]
MRAIGSKDDVKCCASRSWVANSLPLFSQHRNKKNLLDGKSYQWIFLNDAVQCSEMPTPALMLASCVILLCSTLVLACKV